MATVNWLLALALLASFAQAATLEEFVTPYLYSGENYSRDVSPSQFEVNGAQYVMVTISGHDAFVLNRVLSADNVTSYSFVNDTDAIFSILRERNINSTVPQQSKIDEINSLINAFEASRNPREYECEHFTGVSSGRPCTLTRCEACMSIPLCGQVMPYFGDDFLISIIDFGGNVSAMDKGIFDARANISLSTNESYDAYVMLDAASTSLGSVQVHIAALASNHLFGCDESSLWCYAPGRDPRMLFCRPADYNTTALATAQATITALKVTIVTNSSLHAQSLSLYNSTNTRNNYRIMKDENATFAAFFAVLQAETADTTTNANAMLAHISDEELRHDSSMLEELLLNISQLGIVRNFTGANTTAMQLRVLDAKIDAKVALLNSSYHELLVKEDYASLALFSAQLVLEPQDYALQTDLDHYVLQKEALDQVLAGHILPGDIDDAGVDMDYLTMRANGIASTKRAQRAQQAGIWLEGGARVVSSLILNAVNVVSPMSPETKESYARTLPTLIVVFFVVFMYVGSLLLFVFLVMKRRIHMHRVAIIMWAIVFMFLFVLAGIAVITAHALLQQQASRSTFDLFSRTIVGSQHAIVAVSYDNTTTMDSITLMRTCANSLGGNLTAQGKNVSTYEFTGDTCLHDGGTQSISGCESSFSEYPAIVLYPGNSTSSQFYVYYLKKASIRGNDTFYSQCLLSRVFAVN